MDNADIGRLIRGMRLEKGLSQRELAEKLGVCGKTVSKWECGMGAPDIQLWSALSRELGIDLATLHEGRMDVAKKDNGKLSRMRIHVCPSCGNVVLSSAQARISCCGRSLTPLEAKAADEAHLPAIERIGDEYLVRLSHPMDKEHHIAFICLVRDDSFLIRRLYAEGGDEVYIPAIGRRARLYVYCTHDGLFITPPEILS